MVVRVFYRLVQVDQRLRLFVKFFIIQPFCLYISYDACQFATINMILHFAEVCKRYREEGKIKIVLSEWK